MRTPALRDSFRFLLPVLLLAPGMAQAQTADQQPPADVQQRERIEKQLQELRDQQQALLNSMQKQVADFNARIAAMEAELGVTPSKDQPAQADSGTESSAPLPASAQDDTRPNEPRCPRLHPGARHSGEQRNGCSRRELFKPKATGSLSLRTR